MTRQLAEDVTVRPVRADEWSRVRELRIEALRDPMASVAFLETVEQATARPAEEWQSRIAANAEGRGSAQFVAERHGELIGSLTVIVRAAGEPDYFDRVSDVDLPTVVGVFVSPPGRGLGIIDALLDSACEWARARGDRELTLDVHESNLPAVRSEFVSPDGRELGMVKRLIPDS